MSDAMGLDFRELLKDQIIVQETVVPQGLQGEVGSVTRVLKPRTWIMQGCLEQLA